MPSELIRVPVAWCLTERERLAVELLLQSCARSLMRRLPPELELVALDVELQRTAGATSDDVQRRAGGTIGGAAGRGAQ